MPWIRPTAVQAWYGGLPGLHAAVVGLGVTLGQELAGQGIHAGHGAGGCSVDLHEGKSATGVSTPCQRRPVTLLQPLPLCLPRFIVMTMSKAIPSTCQMPDLSTLPTLMESTLLHALIGDPGVGRETRLYRRNFARLVDKAVREYQLARATILAQIEESRRPTGEMARHGRTLHILLFTDHFETCINATHRLLNLLEQLKNENLPNRLPRTLRRSISAHTRPLSRMRHLTEHMDSFIQQDELSAGQPVILGLDDSEDGAVVGDTKIIFDDIAVGLKRLHEIGELLFSAPSGDDT